MKAFLFIIFAVFIFSNNDSYAKETDEIEVMKISGHKIKTRHLWDRLLWPRDEYDKFNQ